MKLSLKLGVATTLLLSIILAAITGVFLHKERSTLDAAALRRARTVISFGEACRQYAREVLSPAVERHTSAFIPEARSATLVARGIFQYLKEKMPEFSFRETSLNPLNLANLADEEETALIARFQSQPALLEVTGHRVRAGREEYYIARPVIVKAVCLQCHDTPATAPPEIVERYGDSHGFGWKEGDVTSALIVSVPAGDLEARQQTAIWFGFGAWAMATLALLGILPLVFNLVLGRRLRKATRVLDEIATQGDLGLRIGDRDRDEIGSICRNFDQMAAQLAEEKEKVRLHTKNLEQLVEERTRTLQAALERAETEKARQVSLAQALTESEERYRLIIQNSLDAIVTVDEDGVITDWNPQAAALFGWTRDEAFGRLLSRTIIPPRFRSEYTQGLLRCANGVDGPLINRRVEMPATHKDGHEVLLELTVSPFRHQGKTYFSAFLRDIGERKRAEKELQESKELAEAASRLKSSFLANVSHEIRTPMTAIMGYACLLKDRLQQDPEALEDVETIERSGLHLLELLNDILDLSKIESGQFELERVACSPPLIIEEVIQVMMVRAEEKGIELRHIYETPIPECIISDPTRIRQVLLNLVVNAVKFTDKGRVTVSVRLEDAQDPKKLVFRVEDTGIGIPEKKLPELFKPFVQLHTTRKLGGTGLGLSISYRLALLLGGELEAESAEGRGSMFRFSFPCELPKSARVFEKEPAATAGRGQQSGEDWSLSGRKVLVVEDTPENQSLMKIQLAKVGASVEVAADGKMAVAKCEVSRYDLVIMDIHMPVMDGFEALAALRGKGIQVPVIAVTADANPGHDERCRAAGFAACISKPFAASDLLDGARRALGKAGG